MRELSARPHHVGSPHGRRNAHYLADLFRSFGFETRIEEFQVLFPTPKKRRLTMVSPHKWQASLEEPKIAEDSTSGQRDEQLPTYNAYSIDGDVTGELVYVNYGVPSDYEELEQRGIDVRGKIVIARYGQSWRGIKPKVAAEKGAIGCIIYSDPSEDGFTAGDAYPQGGWRPAGGVQRGSVADGPLYSGDPLTPGVGATADAPRLKLSEAKTLTKIPVLPISAADAEPLLRALGGPVAPAPWRGALPLTYHLGPGGARVRLELEFDWKLTPALDVIATLKGSEQPDSWILRGNHHDAWVNGATDPVSGLVAELAEARALGELLKTGWRPKRTIVYAAWDAEEQGLMGSTEWVETHAAELREKAVAYVNSDSNTRGFLSMAGSHVLEPLLNGAAREVIDPQKGISVLERARAQVILDGRPAERSEARERSNLRLGSVGAGSDHASFAFHLGIPVLNVGFGGEEHYGQYHSIYDSFDHFLRFGDPKFEYGIALAQVAGRTVLRLSEAEILPLDFSVLAETIGRYVEEVRALEGERRSEAEEVNRRLDEGSYAYVFDPQETRILPKRRELVPFLDFAPLLNARVALTTSARGFSQVAAERMRAGRPFEGAERAAVERLLRQAERALTREQGLPGRPWYRHQIYAPGSYTGYGAKTLPAVREAIEAGRWDEASEQIVVVGETLRAFAREIDRITDLLRTPPEPEILEALNQRSLSAPSAP